MGTTSTFTDIVVYQLPYVTLAVFALGVTWRLQRWMAAPKDPDPIKLDLAASLKYIVLDAILLRKQFKTDKVSWALVFSFHLCVYGIGFGHLRGFGVWSASLFAPLGAGFEDWIVYVFPVYVGYFFIGTLIALLARRIFLERGGRLMSIPEDYIILVLLLAVAILGQGTRVLPPQTAVPQAYDVRFLGLINLHLEKVPNDLWFGFHILTSQLLIMYIPFSKLVHMFSGVVTPAFYGSRRKEFGV